MNENKQPFEQYKAADQAELEAIDTSSFVDGYTYACTILPSNDQPAAQMLWNYSLDGPASPEDGIVKPSALTDVDPGRWVFGMWSTSTLGGISDTVSGDDNIIVDNSTPESPIVKADLTKYPFTPQTTAPTHSEGQLYYDANENNLVIQTNGSKHISLGREKRQRCINNTTSQINKGEVVYFSGAGLDGTIEVSEIDLAFAKNIAGSSGDGYAPNACTFVGMALEDIAGNGGVGEVITSGIARDIDTSGFVGNPIVYVSNSVRGGLTISAPTFPDFECKVGKILTSSTSGSIYISPDTDPPIGSGGIVATGLDTYDVALINSQFSVQLDDGYGFIFTTMVIPTENIIVQNLSIFITDPGSIGTNPGDGMRLGVYDGYDTLISQSEIRNSSSWLSTGINTIPLETAAVLQANEKYFFAVQMRSAGTTTPVKIGFRTSSYNPSSPNHIGRFTNNNANLGSLQSGMESPLSDSIATSTGRRLWMSAS